MNHKYPMPSETPTVAAIIRPPTPNPKTVEKIRTDPSPNNLPIKTYQSTTSSNVVVNIGNKRPIVFKANSLFEGKVDNLNSSRIVRTHYENFNKLLKLKNKYETERNQLDISVRRAKTNELATEITDCSLELTIDTE